VTSFSPSADLPPSSGGKERSTVDPSELVRAERIWGALRLPRSPVLDRALLFVYLRRALALFPEPGSPARLEE
jgi:hypothetical protein